MPARKASWARFGVLQGDGALDGNIGRRQFVGIDSPDRVVVVTLGGIVGQGDRVGDQQVFHRPAVAIEHGGKSDGAPLLIQPDFAEVENPRLHQARRGIGQGFQKRVHWLAAARQKMGRLCRPVEKPFDPVFSRCYDQV